MDRNRGGIESGGFHLRYQSEGAGTPTLVIGSIRYYLWLHFRHVTVRVFAQSGPTPQYEEAALCGAELLSWMKKH
jgi:hypothetical protein